MTDEQIIEGCKQGKADCQKALFDQYKRKLMGVCLRYAGDEDEAHDMLQDGFVKIFQKLDTFNNKGSLVAWMCRLMINNCLDHLRKTKYQRMHVEVEQAEKMDNVQDDVIAAISAKDILRYISEMPTGYRTVFNMFAIEGYSHKEIAEELGVTENTSKSQYRKARFYLMEVIEKNNKVLK
tara:strand:+ start:1760 stop:2299 length:540 start_codon:yes stop_codon:yes gene_type:complete